jgi:hypothetical protein
MKAKASICISEDETLIESLLAKRKNSDHDREWIMKQVLKD